MNGTTCLNAVPSKPLSPSTPWLGFLQNINAHFYLAPSGPSHRPLSHGGSDHMRLPAAPDFGLFHMNRRLTQEIQVNGRWLADPVEQLHLIYIDATSYLPSILYSAQEGQSGLNFNIYKENSFLECLVAVISTGFDEPGLESRLMALLEYEDARSVLGRALSQNLGSVQVCAQYLLLPAVQQGNDNLVRLLVKSGVSLKTSPRVLQYAVEKRYRDIIDVLLTGKDIDFGATLSCKIYSSRDESTIGDRETATILDIAVELGDFDLVLLFLGHENSDRAASSLSGTLRTLRLAVLSSRWDLVILLSDRRPGLWNSAKKAALAITWSCGHMQRHYQFRQSASSRLRGHSHG